jgi:hypothetical protein
MALEIVRFLVDYQSLGSCTERWVWNCKRGWCSTLEEKKVTSADIISDHEWSTRFKSQLVDRLTAKGSSVWTKEKAEKEADRAINELYTGDWRTSHHNDPEGAAEDWIVECD